MVDVDAVVVALKDIVRSRASDETKGTILMRKLTFMRLGFAAVVGCAGVAGGALAGCGGDDSTPATTTDSGGMPDVTVTDSGGMDTSTDSPVADAGQHGKILVVHASPDLPALRVCVALGKKADGSDGSVAPLAALPDVAVGAQPFPGIYPGTGGAFPDVKDLTGDNVTPYVILAQKIASDIKPTDGGVERTCEALVGPTGSLTVNVDYFKLPTIAAGTFINNSTHLLAALGCLPTAMDGTANIARCGPDYVGATGNLAIKIFGLSRTPPTAGTLGADFAHFSGPFSGAPPIVPLMLNGDASVPISATPVAYATVAPATPTSIPGVDPTSSQLAIAFPTADGGIGAVQASSPLLLVQKVTIGSTTPANYFHNDEDYTFVVVGDPAISAAVDAGSGLPTGFNGYGLHFLGFMNNPPFAAK